MKNILIFWAVFISFSAKSQTSDGWLKQKKTKLKYIAQQIAAFQVYAGYLKQGYKIVEQGWSVVDDIKHGDFDLHNNYFNLLAKVSSSISNYNKVDNITALQLQLLETNDDIKKFISSSDYIQPVERDYINKIMYNLLNKCFDDLNTLQMLTQDHNALMKDDERIQRIDDLCADIQEKYAFAKNFESTLQVLALSRAKNANDVNTSKLLYGLK